MLQASETRLALIKRLWAAMRVQTVSVSTEGPRTTHCLAPLFSPLTADSGTFLGQKHAEKMRFSGWNHEGVCKKTSLNDIYSTASGKS